MSSLKRAKTWEVSESEEEDGAARGAISGPSAPDVDELHAEEALECLQPGQETPASPTQPNSDLNPNPSLSPTPSSAPNPTQILSPTPSSAPNPTQILGPTPSSAPNPTQTLGPAPSSEPIRRRRRKKQGQSEAERLQKDQKRAERERRRQEKEREKEEKRQEQRKRKEMVEKMKCLKPENCLKCLMVNIHPVLLQESGCDVLLEVLACLEWRSCIKEHDLTHSISWTRQIPHADEEEGDTVEEDQVVMVVSLTEFMDMVTSVKQALIGDCEGAESLFQPLSEYLNRYTHTVVSLLVLGVQHTHRGDTWDDGDGDGDYPRSQLGVQDVDIEEVLVHLQLCKNVSVHFVYGWKQAADHVCAVTKALSKRPFKLLCEVSQLGFCVDGSWAGGVRVDSGGRGLAQVWTRQVQQLNRVSVAMATALTAAYPSPQSLLQAYQKAESDEQRRALLADLTVRGGAGDRRIGPELSSRVYRLMTSQNPQLVLD